MTEKYRDYPPEQKEKLERDIDIFTRLGYDCQTDTADDCRSTRLTLLRERNDDAADEAQQQYYEAADALDFCRSFAAYTLSFREIMHRNRSRLFALWASLAVIAAVIAVLVAPYCRAVFFEPTRVERENGGWIQVTENHLKLNILSAHPESETNADGNPPSVRVLTQDSEISVNLGKGSLTFSWHTLQVVAALVFSLPAVAAFCLILSLLSTELRGLITYRNEKIRFETQRRVMQEKIPMLKEAVKNAEQMIDML